MLRKSLLLSGIVMISLSACGTSCPAPTERIVTQIQTVSVDKPVAVMPDADASLLTPISRPNDPPFVEIADKDAVMGLTAKGVSAVLSYPLILEQRIKQWETWYRLNKNGSASPTSVVDTSKDTGN